MKKFFLALLLLYSVNSAAQERHPIDQKAYDALQEAVTTVEMMNAQNIAFEGWEQLMKVTLLALKDVSQPATYAALAKSQKAWEQYRDAEYEAINRVYYAELQGTMWRPVAVSARAKLVKQRAQLLMDIYQELAAQQGELYQLILDTWVSNSAAFMPGMSIEDDLTIRYNEGQYKFNHGFYRLGKDCNGVPATEDRMIISFYDFDAKTEAECYYVNVRNEEVLELSQVNGNKSRYYSRKFR